MTNAQHTITRERSRFDPRGYTFTRWSNGIHTHVADADDFSPTHDRASAYDSKCGWCYLNASHSEREHARKTSLESMTP